MRPIHLQLIDEILVEENLQPQKVSERQATLGRSDRACFQQLLANRGRVATEEYLTAVAQPQGTSLCRGNRKTRKTAYISRCRRLDISGAFAQSENRVS